MNGIAEASLVTDIRPVIDPLTLARLFGGKKGRGFSNALKKKVRFWMDRFPGLAEAKVFYRTREVQNVGLGAIKPKDTPSLNSPKLARSLKGSTQMVCFIATIGPKIETQISRLTKKNRMSDAYVLDAIGSVAVESVAEQFQEKIRGMAEDDGKGVSLRFSPGYCDWPVKEQKRLFKLIDPEMIDIRLTDSCLMNPRKSISAVFGLLEDPTNKAAPYNPCLQCRRRCETRRN